MMDITILFGTETGNTEMLAEDLQTALSADHAVSCCNLADFAPQDFTTEIFYLVLCSTYGDGELPASAQPFAAAMAAAAPGLSGVSFAIFGLGDSEYETFNQGSQAVETLLVAAGATRIGERVLHDASGSEMAEDLALPWARAAIAEAAQLIERAA
jgi:MioC protein